MDILSTGEVFACVGEAIRASDNPSIQRALVSSGLSINGKHLTLDAKRLKKAGINPSALLTELKQTVTDLAGCKTEVTHLQRDWRGHPKLKGDAVLRMVGDEATIKAGFTRSPHPVFQDFLKKEAQEAARIKQLEQEWKNQAAASKTLEHDMQLTAEKAARYKGNPETADSLNPDALCVVHATRYMPVRHPDGSVDIQTKSAATRNQFPRNSVHFALNHKVAAHGIQSWDAAGITVIAPFNKCLSHNGAPEVLNTVDTYWTKGLKQSVRIPEATLVLPGDTGGKLFAIMPGETRYKTHHFTEEDIQAVRRALRRDEGDLYKFDEKFAKTTPENRDEFIAASVNEIAVNETIRHLGYDVKPGGMWAWDGSTKTTHKTQALAEQLGTICMADANTVHGKLYDEVPNVTLALDFIDESVRKGAKPVYDEDFHHYFIPGTNTVVSCETYNQLIQGTYFKTILERMKPLLERAPAHTREVYDDWLRQQMPKAEHALACVQNWTANDKWLASELHRRNQSGLSGILERRY